MMKNAMDSLQEETSFPGIFASDFDSIKDLFSACLIENGITRIFGIPGGAIYSIWDRLTHDVAFDSVMTLHEQAAAMMADGYARVTGKPALVLVTAGPGATNTLTGVAIAKSDEIPMIVLTGNARQHQCGKGALQELHDGSRGIDIHQMMRPVVKASFQLIPQNACQVVQHAIKLSQTPPMGPVHINACADVWEQKPVEPDLSKILGVFPDGSVEYVNENEWRLRTEILTRRLLQANKPVFVVGNGVYRANALGLLKSVSEKLGVRVMETPSAQGSFFHAHPLYIGITGFGGHEIANRYLFDDPDVDFIVVIGTSGREASGLLDKKIQGPNREIWHIHPDKTVFDLAFSCDQFIVACAHDVLGFMNRLLPESGRANQKLHDIACKSPSDPETVSKNLISKQFLHPHLWREELSAIMPLKTLVFSDIGGHSFHNTQSLRLSQGSKMIMNWNLGCMGHGVVAPMGAAMGLNETHEYEHVVAIVGDACFMMCGMELMSAARLDSKVLWIIENNRGHNISYHGSRTQGRVLKGVLQDEHINFSAMLSAMGVPAVKINRTEDLRTYLKKFFFEGVKPLVLDCHVDPMIPPPMGARMKTLVSVVLPE